jgi:hypothetical protein
VFVNIFESENVGAATQKWLVFSLKSNSLALSLVFKSVAVATTHMTIKKR